MFEILYFCDNSRHKGKQALKAPYLQITSDGRAGLVKTTGTKAVTEDVDPLDMFLIFCDSQCMKDYIDDKFMPDDEPAKDPNGPCPFCEANPCKKRFKACKA